MQEPRSRAAAIAWAWASRSLRSQKLRPDGATMRNPMYAGTYAYGRCPVDPKRRLTKKNKQARKWVPPEQWKVTIPDHLPAYITWEQFMKNQERITQNQNRPGRMGTPRSGAALLAALLDAVQHVLFRQLVRSE